MRGQPLDVRIFRTGMMALVLAACWGFPGRALAQIQQGNLLPHPRLTFVSPCGAKMGTTIEMTFSGTDLEEPEAMVFSHPGIKGVPVIPPLPPPPKVDPKNPKKAPPPPVRLPITKFTVTVAANVPVGFYDVRLVNKWGVSNSRTFVVGDLKEVMEKEPNNDVDQAQQVELGTTINGVISAPTDVDYTTFTGKRGQRVVISCLGEGIDSKINPEIRVFDKAGRELAVSRPATVQDAVTDVILPEDGEYFIRLCQFTYTGGGADYFYRLNISTGPWIDLVVPPMVEPGKTATVSVFGRNLPGGKPDPAMVIDGKVLEKITVNITAPKDPQGNGTRSPDRLSFTGRISPLLGTLDGFEYRLTTPAGTSNPFLITFAQAPVVMENDNNDTPETAQELPVPVEVAGRIDKRRDRDWYSFTAKKGDVYVIEVLSERLGAPTDIYFTLRNPAAKQDIVQLDDNLIALTKNFFTVTRDPPSYRFVVPADGKYQLQVASHLGDNLAGPQHYYRLRISPENPDFRLIVMPPDDYRPDSGLVGQGSNNYFTVFAERRDGFNGEIVLAMEGLPAGVTCSPQRIGAGMKEALLVVSAGATAAPWTGEIKIKGTAQIMGKNVVREARPASITWAVPPQQNIPTLSRLDRSLVLAVRGKAPYSLGAVADKTTITHGTKVNIKLTLNRLWPDATAPVQVQQIPAELPPNIKFGNITIPTGKSDATLVLDVPASVKPGTYSLVFRSFAPVPFSKNPKDKKKGNVNVVLPSTPVVLTVLPKEVAKLTVPGSLNAKVGNQTDLVVQVNRLYDFQDSFKVQLVLPPNTQGLEAAEATIPAGQNQVKLPVRVLANAAPGNRPNLVVRVTAVIQGNVTLIHEAKTNINVVK